MESASPIDIEGKRLSRRRGGLLWTFVVIAALSLPLGLSQLKSPYGRYVSPPLDVRGTRISLLVPRAWNLHWSNPPPTAVKSLDFEAPEQYSWLPQWVIH